MDFIHVGVGGFGRCWVEQLAKDDRANVVGLVDVNDAALAAARDMGGYGEDICFHSLEDALNTVSADALVCSTPPAFHRHDVVTAMEAGLDVISEKPMADSLADCKAMLRAAKATGRTYCVSQNYRYRPPTWTMADLVRRGELGDVGQAKLDFFMGVNFGGGFRHEMPYPLIIDMSIHHFDLLRFITGLDAVQVSAQAWNPPWSNYAGECSSTVLFEMNNGARVLYNGSWCSKGQFCDWNGNWQVEGERGSITHERGAVKLHKVPEVYKVEETVDVDLTAPPLEAQTFVLDDFIKAVEAGGQPKTNVFDNIKSVAMVFATVKAMDSGATVEVLDDEIRELLAD